MPAPIWQPAIVHLIRNGKTERFLIHSGLRRRSPFGTLTWQLQIIFFKCSMTDITVVQLFVINIDFDEL